MQPEGAQSLMSVHGNFTVHVAAFQNPIVSLVEHRRLKILSHHGHQT